MEIRIDEVVKTKADVEALGICNGDFVGIDPKVQITESGFIKSRFLDDKISASALMGVLQPVSYTHLDVYKRQDPLQCNLHGEARSAHSCLHASDAGG